MFTGIVEATAQVLDRAEDDLVLERPSAFGDVKTGSSICVSGACLSVVEADGRSMRFAVMEETRRRTTLGGLKKGDRVNLERALSAGNRFEGHIVQGHVDGVGEIQLFDGETLTVAFPKELRGLIVEKGSIAVDGVSLTITGITAECFSVSLIPLTIERTTLVGLSEGDGVNLETDIVGKYIRHAQG